MPVNRFDMPPSGQSPEGPDADDDETVRGGPEAVQRLHRQFEELGEYVRVYLAARGDAIRASLRRLALWLVVVIAALVVLVAMLATAAAIAILGVADVVGQALGRPWAGYVVTGFGLLAIGGLVLMAATIILRRRFRNRTVEKYARRHREQRARFGRDVTERATPRQSERG
ncbi:MAG: hypothetical protein WD063_14445 [Pirellulales bacterium]